MFKSYTISRMLRGGETMKTLGFVLAFVMAMSVASFADTAEFDLYGTSKNMVSLPQVPLNSDPLEVFASSSVDPSYNITRWTGVGYVSYDPDDPTGYGNMLLGDGFWCGGSKNAVISYEAVADGVPDSNGQMTDMWISLPGAGNGNGGRHLIGTPFAHEILVDKGSYNGDNIFFTDGTTLLTWGEACQDPYNWIGPTITYWTGLGYDDVWYDGSNPEAMSLMPGRAYWVATSKDNLAMIIPAD